MRSLKPVVFTGAFALTFFTLTAAAQDSNHRELLSQAINDLNANIDQGQGQSHHVAPPAMQGSENDSEGNYVSDHQQNSIVQKGASDAQKLMEYCSSNDGHQVWVAKRVQKHPSALGSFLGESYLVVGITNMVRGSVPIVSIADSRGVIVKNLCPGGSVSVVFSKSQLFNTSGYTLQLRAIDAAGNPHFSRTFRRGFDTQETQWSIGINDGRPLAGWADPATYKPYGTYSAGAPYGNPYYASQCAAGFNFYCSQGYPSVYSTPMIYSTYGYPYYRRYYRPLRFGIGFSVGFGNRYGSRYYGNYGSYDSSPLFHSMRVSHDAECARQGWRGPFCR